MKKNYVIFKEDLNSFLSDVSKAMTEAKIFYNVTTKEHKEGNKIVVVIG